MVTKEGFNRQKFIKKFKRAEKLAVKWLRERGYSVTKWHENKASNKYFDILASKGKEEWIIEVKSGKKPSIKIENVIKMMETQRVKKIGLIFISDENGIPILFELNRMSYAGFKASKTKGKNVESEAARKAWIKRRNNRKVQI